mgnify:CR=1 FL=1
MSANRNRDIRRAIDSIPYVSDEEQREIEEELGDLNIEDLSLEEFEEI